MTIYYFKNKRFPRQEKRFELRRVFDEFGEIPAKVLSDATYFEDFALHLPESIPGKINRFSGRTYASLEDEDKTTFDLRTIRNIIIRQNKPEDSNSVVFEIFNRLNTGGMNLKPQEIRTSLFHSKFYDMLYKINLDANWRKLTPGSYPDLHMKDIEIILRGFAMLYNHATYKPSMLKFLNSFSAQARNIPDDEIAYCSQIFREFCKTCAALDHKIFISKSGRFNISVFEAILVASCEAAFLSKTFNLRIITGAQVAQLKNDADFLEATQSRTSSAANVRIRIGKAQAVLS